MPRKNKKKQRKEERRKTMQRVRQEKGWQPPPDVEFPDDELMRDLLTFIPDLGGDQPPGQAAAETLTTAVLDSYDLVDEPEFGEIWFHPMQTIDVYAELEEERGVTEELLNALSEEEEDDLFFDLMVEIARRSLTEQMQADILEAMDAVWQRVRQEGDQEKAGRLAAMLVLLGSEDGEEVWPEVGLVQAILRRSLDAGFELVSVMESAGAADMSLRTLWQSGMDPGVQEQFMAILQKYPGLEALVSQQDEELWQVGLQALMDTELYIGFFSDEELKRAAEILIPEVPGDSGLADADAGRANIQALQGHIAGLLTPVRRAEMREQLLTMLEDEALVGEWEPFLVAMLYDLNDEDPDTALVFLTAAMIGEMADMEEMQSFTEDEAQG
jgi:hypothetical protein